MRIEMPEKRKKYDRGGSVFPGAGPFGGGGGGADGLTEVREPGRRRPDLVALREPVDADGGLHGDSGGLDGGDTDGGA